MMVYLDNSATTYPKPPQVIRAVSSAMQSYGFNPGRGGYQQSMRTAEKLFDVRKTVKDFFGVQGEERIIFTSGCTQALNIVLKGLLKPGDHVVISSLEHNAVVRPIHRLKEKGIINYSIAEVSVGDDDETLRHFRNAFNEHTRLIVCTHASNVFGFRLPVERICALAHQYGVLFCLDAAQSAGVLPINMQSDHYDFVCCAGHKYLYGPMGTGLLLIGNDILLDTLTEGGTGSVSDSLLMPEFYPDRLEAGTLNVPGIIGLKAGLDFVSHYTVKSVYEKEKRMIRLLHNALSDNSGIQAYYNQQEDHFDAPVLSFTVKGKDSESVAKLLGERYNICVRAGLHCAPLAHRSMHTDDTGTVRVSPSVFTTQRDIELLINSLRKIR